MGRAWFIAVGLTLASSAAAAPLEAPQFTIRPQGAMAAFTGETVSITIGWRPVAQAAKYRLAITDAKNQTTQIDVTGLRHELTDLAPGKYQVTVAALDASGMAGPTSELLYLSVIEMRAIPPGSSQSMPPQRGAYAVGTRFAVGGMHCEFSDAPIDDLLVGPENEVRMPIAGVARLRCAGIPGYLEKQVVIAPVAIQTVTPATRGVTTDVHVTVASVAFLGEQLDVEAIGDLTLGDAQRTDFGFEVPVHVAPTATSAALSIQTGDFELGRTSLQLIDAPPPPPPPVRKPLDWRALDLGGHAGAFVPSDGGHAPTIGMPTDPADVVSGGPLVGLRLGFFPTRRVGLEGEISLIEAGHGDREGTSHVVAGRAQLAVRAVESGNLGLRVIAGTGTFTNLSESGTARVATQGEIHAGGALTIETSPNLWLRFQFVDAVTTARDDGYSHCLELQLGVVTRVGRRDSW
ncbi:MAG TPA: hypothetical protein VMZ53_14225 [Kofleriaceae bacterium]|nr:hypothetical protein [Kofleriaceae bacterium]